MASREADELRAKAIEVELDQLKRGLPKEVLGELIRTFNHSVRGGAAKYILVNYGWLYNRKFQETDRSGLHPRFYYSYRRVVEESSGKMSRDDENWFVSTRGMERYELYKAGPLYQLLYNHAPMFSAFVFNADLDRLLANGNSESPCFVYLHLELSIRTGELKLIGSNANFSGDGRQVWPLSGSDYFETTLFEAFCFETWVELTILDDLLIRRLRNV